VTIVHRGAALGDGIKYWVKPDIENRIREGSIAARFETRVIEIGPTLVVVERDGARETIPADAVFLLTGYRSDNALLASAGVEINSETCGPHHDPETFETNVPRIYVVGAAVAGRQSGRIFIENGRFHGGVVVEQIAKRLA
jgi:thioredoxin reductase (NADPH)